MLQLKTVPDIWSALISIIPAARSKPLACIVKKTTGIYVGHSDTMAPDAIVELQKFEIILLIVEGKPTKSTLSDEERKYFTERVRESNAWLN